MPRNPFGPADKPKTDLGYHRILGPNAGVKVSPFCLGTMSFGTNWARLLGDCSKEDAFELMDAYSEMGGNFIDT